MSSFSLLADWLVNAPKKRVTKAIKFLVFSFMASAGAMKMAYRLIKSLEKPTKKSALWICFTKIINMSGSIATWPRINHVSGKTAPITFTFSMKVVVW